MDKKKIFIFVVALVVIVAGGAAYFLRGMGTRTPTPQTAAPSAAQSSETSTTLSGSVSQNSGSGISPQLFGLDPHPNIILKGNIPWPGVPFGTLRLWNTFTAWSQIETASGTYNWTNLDKWFALAAQHEPVTLMYTFGVTPTWVAANPNDATCKTNANRNPGNCDPPSDVNSDGTGTDLIWKNFVTAIVTHASGRIGAWELWNEPNVPGEWDGTNAQLIRMAQDAYTIIHADDPGAIVTTPTPVNFSATNGMGPWMARYLADGGGAYADVITFHGYIAKNGPPEGVVPLVSAFMQGVPSSLSAKPVWDTESAFNESDPQMEAAYLARMYLLQVSSGVSRFYWFQYGDSEGEDTLWSPSTNALQDSGIAYGQVYQWLVGATLTSPCASSGNIWTCSFTKPGGIQEEAVWDASSVCANGSCTTSSFIPAATYTKYMTLSGGSPTSFTPGSSVQISAEPILLDN